MPAQKSLQQGPLCCPLDALAADADDGLRRPNNDGLHASLPVDTAYERLLAIGVEGALIDRVGVWYVNDADGEVVSCVSC